MIAEYVGMCLMLLCGAFHMAAVVLLPYKLHTSRSAAGVSLKTQELYLLVHLTRLAADIGFDGMPMATYYGVMEIAKLGLTAVTIWMMRRRPSLRASYDSSLDNFRSWAHGVIPAFVLTLVVWGWECSLIREGPCWIGDFTNLSLVYLWIFSLVLEPLAVMPQLLVFSGCTDAGRLTGVYVSLMVAYRATFLLSRILSCFVFTDLGEISSSASTTTTSVLIIFDPLEIIISTIQTVTLVAFLVDWRLRTYRRSPPDESGDMTGADSAIRERLLPHQDGTDDYSGDGAAAGTFGISGGGGAASGEARFSRPQNKGVNVVGRIEDILLRERSQEGPSLHHSSSASAVTVNPTRPEGGSAGGGGDESHLV